MDRWRRACSSIRIHPWTWRWTTRRTTALLQHIITAPAATAHRRRWYYWGLPYRPLLPHKVYGVAINYADHSRPHLFSRPPSPSNNSTNPKMDAEFPHEDDDERRTNPWWLVLDHCNGLLLYATDDWDRKLCVCNPATRRWTVLPPPPTSSSGQQRRHEPAYLVFEPAVSPHYQVILVPGVRKVDLPAAAGRTTTTEDDEEKEPWWPPSTWTMSVFSSRTGRWEDRAFVRKGEPAGTVQDMLLDKLEPTEYGPRQRYAAYWKGVLYVHCRGHFILRLALSKGKYRVFKLPVNYINIVKPYRGRVKKFRRPTMDTKNAKPYFGRLKDMLCYGIVYGRQLRIWMLNDEYCSSSSSSSPRRKKQQHARQHNLQWVLKYEVDVGICYDYVRPSEYDENGIRKLHRPWMVDEEDDITSSRSSDVDVVDEWDSDNDDVFTKLDVNTDNESSLGMLDVMGFHPSKKVVFLASSWFGVTAYHLETSKFQYLGIAYPQCYIRNYSNAIYESFVYTPCMIGDLLLPKDRH